MIRAMAILFAFCVANTFSLSAQQLTLGNYQLEAIDVLASPVLVKGKKAIRVIKSSVVSKIDEPTFLKVKNFAFTNGTIEVKVLSRLLPDAPDFARGFIGIAFRINDSNSKYESIYIRPANGRAEDQVRRNHSIQYYSYPDFKFDRLRQETPGKYESYADMALNEWIRLKIVVNDSKAQLFINDNKQPALIVNDLKHGSTFSGSVGLWVEVGTEGFFSDLKIYKK